MNFNSPALDYYKTEEAMLLLRSISHPTRIKILNLLLENGELTQTDICQAFPHFNKEMLTRHLNIMFSSDMIDKSREDEGMVYRACEEKIEKIMHLLSDFS